MFFRSLLAALMSFIAFIAFIVFGVSASYSSPALAEEKNSLEIDAALPAFALDDFRGRQWKSAEFDDSKVLAVVFFGTECPLVQLYARRLSEIEKEIGTDNVQFVGIDSNRQDSLAEIEAFAKSTGVNFPLLKDPGNKIADLFHAVRTPEVFLFDQDRKLQYRGRIDDQYTYGRQKPKVEREYVLDAVRAIMADKQPDPQITESVGCHIGRQFNEPKSNEVNYSQHISRIIQSRCVECHREGEIAPFSLTDYDEVVGWAEMMREVVNERRMPPWHANPKYGTFANDAGLTDEEIRQINVWVDNGAPEGNSEDLPEPKQFVAGWQIGEPDLVVAMDKRPFEVPATGVLDYEYFVVDPKFKEDKYITAAEIRIGNRAVVHHVIVASENKKNRKVHGAIGSEWVTACAPGSPPLQLPEGYAKLVPAGSHLIFQMHYTPNGIAGEDLTKVGFKFVDKSEVKKIVATVEIANERLRIPPNAANHEVKAERKIRQNALLLTLFPHMHLRGKAFRYTAVYPDGKSEILLDVPNYDFNWQNGYHFETPVKIPAGTVLKCVAHFDNSKKNIANPDPSKTVRWGDQTFEEMMIGYFDAALADQDLQADAKSDSR